MIKNQKITPEEKQLIIKLRSEGKSLNQIVREIQGKISPQRVDSICKAEELKVLKSNNG